jgi:hypothetical protein
MLSTFFKKAPSAGNDSQSRGDGTGSKAASQVMVSND